MVSGDYGTPPSYRIWAIQLVCWTIIIPLVKIILLVVILLGKGILGNLGHFLLDWLQPYPKIELVVVMILCPCLMNLFQYWIQDTFLKKKKGEKDEEGDLELLNPDPNVAIEDNADSVKDDML